MINSDHDVKLLKGKSIGHDRSEFYSFVDDPSLYRLYDSHFLSKKGGQTDPLGFPTRRDVMTRDIS